MPLAAIRHKQYDGTEVVDTVRGILDRAANDPFFKYPYPILKSMLEQEARPEGISITMLGSGCLRCEVLKKYTPYTADIGKLWPAWRGTTYHANLENHPLRGDIIEVRFYAKLYDPTTGEYVGDIHGKPDIIRVPQGDPYEGITTIVDLKTTQQVPTWDKVWSNHNYQLQRYRWLINNAYRWDSDLGGIDPTRLNIGRLGCWYVDDKTCKPIEVRKAVEVPTTSPTAKSPTKTRKVPDVWTDEEVLGFILPQYRELTEAFEKYEVDGTLPPYPPQFNFIRDWSHQWSPVAEQCVEAHFAAA